MTKSLTSLATLAKVRGGKFSELPVPELPIAEPTPDPERERVDDRRDGLADPESELESEDEREEEVPMLPLRLLLKREPVVEDDMAFAPP